MLQNLASFECEGDALAKVQSHARLIRGIDQKHTERETMRVDLS